MPVIDEQELVRLASDLINIPSVTGSEWEVAEFLVQHMRALGLQAHLQEIEDGRPNAIGMMPGSGDGPSLVFNGHLDTATTGQPEADYAGLGALGPGHLPRAYVKDGQVYGLGAYNMKGGIAAAVTAVGALARAGAKLRGDILIAAVSGESENAPVEGLHRSFQGARYRGGGVGTRYYLTHGPVPDLAVVCEPSNLYVNNADAGYVFVKLVIQTSGGIPTSESRVLPGGAASVPPDAVGAMTRVIQAIEAWKPQYRERHAFSTGLGVMEPTLHVGAVESGWPFKPTYGPPVAYVYLAMRLTPAMRPTTPLAELRELLDRLRTDAPWFDYGLDVYASNFPSTVTDASHHLVEIALRARERVLGTPQGVCPSQHFATWNDSNIFRQHGIPAIIVGPSWDASEADAAHPFDRGQHVSIRQLGAAARMYALIASEVCSMPRAAAMHTFQLD